MTHKNIDQFPCRYCILIIRKKAAGGDTEHLSYGTDQHPFPADLLGRGFGCLFKTKELAEAALKKCHDQTKDHRIWKQATFKIVPMYQTWDEDGKEYEPLPFEIINAKP